VPQGTYNILSVLLFRSGHPNNLYLKKMKLLLVACIAAMVGYASTCNKSAQINVPKHPAKYPSTQSKQKRVIIEYRNLLLVALDNKDRLYKHRALLI